MAGPEDWGAAETRALDVGAGESGARALLPKPVYELAEFAYSAPAFLRLERARRLGAPQIIYERYNLYFHAGVRLSKARRLPLLLEVNAPLAEERARHGGLAFPALARASERSLWRAAGAVLPVTNVLARMIEAAGVPPERIHVVHNGADGTHLQACDPRPIRAHYGLDGKIVLGFLGFVRDWHGVDRVLRSMARAERKDTHLLLVGDGTARGDLEALARGLGLAGRFTVTGVVQPADIGAHIAAFDIALQPAATAYASPLKQFDYMAQARAILAPAQANIMEILTDGADALLFAPGDEAAMGAALSRLIDDDALRDRLGAAARETLLRRDLTWSGAARRVEAIAEALLQAQRR